MPLHGQTEAEVGHDGDHHGVAGQLAALGQVQREEGQEDVPVDHRTVVVDRDDPVGVPVEGQTKIGTSRDNDPRQFGGVGRAALLVDVDAIGRMVQRGSPVHRVLRGPGRDHAGCTVGTIDHDVQTGQTRPSVAAKRWSR